MAFADTLETVARVVSRETLGAVVRAKAKRADNLERIADLMQAMVTGDRRRLEIDDYKAAGADEKIPPAVIHAVSDAETGKDGGFDAMKRPTNLVEPHLFSSLTGHAFDRSHPHISYPKWVRNVKGAAPPAKFRAHPYDFNFDERWGLFLAMAELDFEAACGSMSVGRFQQVTGSPRPNMGWKALRYQSAEALLRKLATSEHAQLEVLLTFFRAHGLKPALRELDWRAIALAYNGPGQVDAYAARMAEAYQRRARIYY